MATQPKQSASFPNTSERFDPGRLARRINEGLNIDGLHLGPEPTAAEVVAYLESRRDTAPLVDSARRDLLLAMMAERIEALQ